MNEEYLNNLYQWISSEDDNFSSKLNLNSFKQKMVSDNSYASRMYEWISDVDDTFASKMPIDSFMAKIKTGQVADVKKKDETLPQPGQPSEVIGQPSTGTPTMESGLTLQSPTSTELVSPLDGSTLASEEEQTRKQSSDYQSMISMAAGQIEEDDDKYKVKAIGKKAAAPRPNVSLEEYADVSVKLPVYKYKEGEYDPNKVFKPEQSYTQGVISAADKLGMTPEDYLDVDKRLKRQEEIRADEKAIEDINREKKNLEIENAYVKNISKTYGINEDEVKNNLPFFALKNTFSDPEGRYLMLDSVDGVESFDPDDVLNLRQQLAEKAINTSGIDLKQKAFEKIINKNDGDVVSSEKVFDQGMEDVGYMFLNDQEKEIKKLQESILILESNPNITPEEKRKLETKKEELTKFMREGLLGYTQLFDPSTGKFVSSDEASEEVISFNNKVNNKVKSYENTDLGKLKKYRDDVYFSYQAFVLDFMLDQKPTGLSPLAIEAFANRYGIDTYDERTGKYKSTTELLNMFTKEQKKEMALEEYKDPFNFHGWDLGGTGDMSQAFKIMNSDIFPDDVTEKAIEILADYMSANRMINLNEDPGSVQESYGLGRFLTYAGKALKESVGVVPENVEFVADRAIENIKKAGFDLTLQQQDAIKQDMTQKAGEAIGGSLVPMAEIMVNLALVNKAAAVAKIPALIKTISGGNKIAEFGLGLTYEMASQGAAFEMAGQEFVGGAGEGFGQFLVDAALKKLNIDNRVLSVISKSVGGALSETAAEYTGQFVDELSKKNIGFDKAVERTFGKTPEDAMEKFALTYLVSQIYGLGTSTVSTLTNPLTYKKSDYEQEISNEQWSDWASKQVISFDSDSPIVNEIKKFAEEQQAQSSPVQKTEIESILEFEEKKLSLEDKIENSEATVKRAERISELNSLLASDAASLQETGTGNLLPEAKQEVQQELETLKSEQNAIQEQTAGQVSVQPETAVSETVEEGKPQAEPQVVTEKEVGTVDDQGRSAKPGDRLFNDPNPETSEISSKYKQSKGISTSPGENITELDIDNSMRLADAYEEMQDNPSDPEVQEAYNALAKETVDQYKAMTEAGYEIEIYEGDGEPYANSQEMIDDLKNNKHMYIFSTESGFGEQGITDTQRKENSMLQDSGFKDKNGKPLLINDLFRGVHDFFGHSERGNGFGAKGEENAWDVHARMFTDKARRAMTTETRGQNSWVNFGPQMRNESGQIIKKGEPGYLSATERAFAPQKMGLLPLEFSNITDDKIEVETKPELTEGANKLLDALKPKVDKPNVRKQVDNAKKAISKISPETKIIVHETSQDYTSSKKGRKQNEGGEYDIDNNTIHINLEAANERTVAHEVFHAILLNKGMSDKQAQSITSKMLDAVKKSASPELTKRLDDFSSKYDEPLQSEESIAELFGILASEYETLPRPTQNLLKRWLDKLAKLFGLKPFTDSEIIDMLNVVSKKVEEGVEIKEKEIKPIRKVDIEKEFEGGIPVDELTDADMNQDQTSQWEGGKSIDNPSNGISRKQVGDFDVQYTEQNRLDELLKEGLVTQPKDVSQFEGQMTTITSPDDMLAGSISIDGNVIFEGGGGVFFVTKYGDVWASGKAGTANTIANSINKSLKKNGGSGYLTLTKGSDTKLISSASGVNSSMAVIGSMFDKGLISASDFRRAISASIKKHGGQIRLTGDALTLKEQVNKYFSDPKTTTFQKRGDVMRDFLGVLSQSQSIKNNNDAIVSMLGGNSDKKIAKKDGIKSQGLAELVAGVASEQLTKGLSTGDVYAVIEVSSEVVVVEDSHPSYPFHIRVKDGSKPVLHLLQNRENGIETLQTSTGKKYKVGNVSVLTGSFNESRTSKKIEGLQGKDTKEVVSKVRKQVPEGTPSIAGVRAKAKELNISESDTISALKQLGYSDAEISTEAKSRMDKAINDAKDKYELSVKKRGNKHKDGVESALNDLKKSDWYNESTDTKREEAVREIEEFFGEKIKKAPSADKVLGNKKNKVTVDEMAALKSQIRLEAGSSRKSIKAYKDAAKSIIEAVKQLEKKGLITLNQSTVIIKKVLSTNMLNENMVDKLTDYIEKVYKKADISDKILTINKLRKRAIKNLKSKVGPFKELQQVLKDLFSIDGTSIPINKIDSYIEILEQFGGSSTVLNLSESGGVLSSAYDILKSIEKVDDVDIESVSLTNELNETIEEDFEGYIKEIISNKIDLENVQKGDAKKLAEFLNSLTKSDLEALVKEKKDGTKDYSMLEKLKELKSNMTNGYVNKLANTIRNTVEINRGKDLVRDVIKKVTKISLSVAFSRAYGKIKGVFTNKSGLTESIRGTNSRFIDDILGNYNSSTIYDNTIGRLAKAWGQYTSDLSINVQSKLDAAENLLYKTKIPTIQKLTRDVQLSKFKIQAYRLQREFQSNLDNKSVASAIDFINETIIAIKKNKAGENSEVVMKRDIGILEQIKKEFTVDGEISMEGIYNSFSKNEKKALELIDEAGDIESKYLWVATVIRGAGVKPINNYIHHNVLDITDNKKITDINGAINTSSIEAGTVRERTPGAKAINFDPISSTLSGAKDILLDYHMTNALNVANGIISSVKKTEGLTPIQQEAINAVENVKNELIENALINSFSSLSTGDKIIRFAVKTGYAAALASIPRAGAELGSNLTYAFTQPQAFLGGVKNFGGFAMNTVEAMNAMVALNSSETKRLYNADAMVSAMTDSSLLASRPKKSKKVPSALLDQAAYIAQFTGLKQLKSLTETVADKSLSTPDKIVSRPFWFGAFALQFKKETGISLTKDDMSEISNGTSKYLGSEYDSARNEAVKYADSEMTKMATSSNPFNSTLKNIVKPSDKFYTQLYKTANGYMASFMMNEYNTTRNSILSLLKSGKITKGQATATIIGIQTRVLSYMILYKLLSSMFYSLFGAEDEDHEDLEGYALRQMVGGPISMITGRGLGQMPRVLISLGTEKFNEKYLQDLRDGREYDSFKHSIVFSLLSPYDIEKKSPEENFIKTIAGPYSPAFSTLSNLVTDFKRIETSDKPETVEKYKKDLQEVASVKVLGNLSLLPFYKDIITIIKKNKYKGYDKDKSNKDKKRIVF
jgi:hypothetical protein